LYASRGSWWQNFVIMFNNHFLKLRHL
jgi:hypothetical protein